MATTVAPTEKKLPQVQEKLDRKQRPRLDDKLKVFSGTANQPLADEVCEFLGLARGQAFLTRFKDGEHYVQPYYGYARQDRKDKPRVPISAKLVADLLTTAGADRALIVDLHTPQLQGFFNIPVDHLFASPVLVDYFKKLALPNLTVVSPDAGGVERARFFAKKMDSALAIVDKRRTDINVAEVMHVIGDVRGRTCLVLDDLIDTAGTLVKTAHALLENGALSVYSCASHAVLSGPAVENIANSPLVEVVVTNTIPLNEAAAKEPKIKVRSIAGLIGSAIRSIHEETSVSNLFA